MKKCLLLIFLSLLLNACGEFSYKRGASAQDLEITKKTCQSSGTEEAIDNCMKQHGWVVQKLDGLADIDLFMTTSESDNRSGKAIESKSENKKPASSSGFIDAEKAEASTSAVTTSATEKAQSDVVAVEKNRASQPETEKPAVSQAPPNPLDKFTINSWWKMGAGQASLESDMNTCAAKLGDGHQTDTKTQTVTRGLIICMREKGWRALRAK